MIRTKWKTVLLAACALTLTVAAASCSGGDHTHSYSEAWTFDSEAHWHSADCSHDAASNKSKHSFTETVIPPSAVSEGYTLYVCACGYSYTSDRKDPLPAETEYRYDGENHWKPLLSEEGVPEKEAHDYREEEIPSTCSSMGYTKHTCRDCGYWYASDTKPLSAHTDGNAYAHSENGHWHVCLVCGAQTGVSAAHNFTETVVPATCEEGGHTRFACTACGYTFTGRETSPHNFGEDFEHDDYKHWRKCTGCSETTDEAEHILLGRSKTCVVCGKDVTPRLAYELNAGGDSYTVTGIGCFDTTSVEIPATYREKNVTAVAAGAFRGEEITSVTIAEGIAIGQSAFFGCEQLQTVTLNGSEIEIPASAFEGCIRLETVNGKPKEVGALAFSGCVELQTLDLSELATAGYAAFSGCEKFAPASLEKLGTAEGYAFSETAVQTVTLPASLSFIAENLFMGCEKLTTLTVNGSIGAGAFADCVLLSSVTLNGTETVGEEAFMGCTALSELTLPETVVRVGADAFTGTGLIQTKSNAKYAANVLVGAEGSPAEIALEAGTVGIADEAFKGNRTLASVTLVETARFIGVNAFRGCKQLRDFTFSQVKLIGANAFRESGLTSVSIPNTVETVGDNAFFDCESLTSVEVRAKHIGKFAFSYTGVGRDLAHPVKQRPAYAKLQTLTIGEGVEEIGSNAFQYAPISSVTLPSGLKNIGMYAFAQTDLENINIVDTVTKIGEYAFYGCEELSSVTFANAENWKAGSNSLTLGEGAANAELLKTTYVDYEWVRG